MVITEQDWFKNRPGWQQMLILKVYEQIMHLPILEEELIKILQQSADDADRKIKQ